MRTENEVNAKLDTIIEALARIEERTASQKETTDKLEKEVENLNKDVNKGKGALALVGFAGAIVAVKSLFLR